jgi:2-polyprenyl-3-methyl-5-hydroxy-6-metoxy-1,4-benzoquinol methylase
MDTKILHAIKAVYQHKTFADSMEQRYKRRREKLFGVNRSIFAKTILYYRDTQGKHISPAAALAFALDKNAHKEAWFTQPRNTVDNIMHFYQEVHIYPFRQPYLKRFGGFRWYGHLVKHCNQPRILEYGCGSAVLTEYLQQKFPHYQYTVADIPSVTLDFVKWKQKKFGYDYTILTIGPHKEGIPLRTPYDLIICQDVLEHTPNPLDIVTAFATYLAPGGVLVVDFINAPGGENLPLAVAQRNAVKDYLKEHLLAVKLIDEPGGNNGLYVKDG